MEETPTIEQLPPFQSNGQSSAICGKVNSSFFLENDNISDRINSCRQTSKEIRPHRKAFDKIRPSLPIQTTVEDFAKDRKKCEDSKPIEFVSKHDQTNCNLSDGIVRSNLSLPIPLVHMT